MLEFEECEPETTSVDNANSIVNAISPKPLISEDEDSIDIGAIKAQFAPQIFGTQNEDSKEPPTLQAPPPPVTQIVRAPLNVQQDAFTPASSPKHLQQRFMLWNSIGIVFAYDTDTETTIDVEFHSSSVHHSVHLDNSHTAYTLAALSNDAIVLANERKLFCLHFGSWDSSREWSVQLGDEDEEEEGGEKIELVCATSSHVSCVTNRNFLRIFSIGGLQLAVLSLSGPIVTLTAKENQVHAVHHQAAGLSDDQNLVLSRFSITSAGLSSLEPLCVALTPKSTLVWFGFTDEGGVATHDSKGYLRLAQIKGRSCMWIPIANTKQHCKKSGCFWLVGLSELAEQMRGVLCKGCRYPSVLPRPNVACLPFKMPFLELETDKAQMEENYCRTLKLQITLKQLEKQGFQVEQEAATVDRNIVDYLMKLFAFSTRSEREFRALEVAHLMPSPRIVQGAIRYASQLHCSALADRLTQLAQEKSDQQQQEEEVDDEEEMVAIETYPSNRLSMGIQPEAEPIQPLPINRLLSNFRKKDNVSSSNRRSNQSITPPPVATIEDNDDKSLPSNHSDDEIEEAIEEESEEIITTPKLNCSNPFKISSQSNKSSNGIDAILSDSIRKKQQCTPSTTPKISDKKPVKKRVVKRKPEEEAEPKETNGQSKKSKKVTAATISDKTLTKISAFMCPRK